MSTTVLRIGAGSNNAYATNEKPVDMYPSIFKDYPNLTPLTVILSRLTTAPMATNSRIDWTEGKDMPTTITGITAAYDATTLTVADYTYLANHSLLFVPRTKELISVTMASAVDVTSTSVTVVRGVGDTSGAAIVPTDVIQIMSTAFEEGSEKQYFRSPVNGNAYNYTQVIEHFIKTTGTANAEKTAFGDKRIENQAKLWREFRIKFEKNLFYGHRSSTAGDSFDRRTMSGLVEKLATGTNVLTVSGGILTESAFDNWLIDVWNGMADAEHLTLFASGKLIQIINHMAKPLITMSPNSKMYGLQLKRYTGAINVDLVPVPLFNDNITKGWGFLLDLNRVKLKWLRKPVLKKNYSGDLYDDIRDKIVAEPSLIVANEIAHGFIENAMA